MKTSTPFKCCNIIDIVELQASNVTIVGFQLSTRCSKIFSFLVISVITGKFQNPLHRFCRACQEKSPDFRNDQLGGIPPTPHPFYLWPLFRCDRLGMLCIIQSYNIRQLILSYMIEQYITHLKSHQWPLFFHSSYNINKYSRFIDSYSLASWVFFFGPPKCITIGFVFINKFCRYILAQD